MRLVILLALMSSTLGCGERGAKSEVPQNPKKQSLVQQLVDAKDEVELGQRLLDLRERSPEVMSEILAELKASDEVLWRIGKLMNLARQLGQPELARLAGELDRIRVQSEYVRDVAGSLQDELKAPRFEPSTGESWEEWWKRSRLKDEKPQGR